MKYNGWTNKETWLVNIHYGDWINEDAPEVLPQLAEGLGLGAVPRENTAGMVGHIADYYEDYVTELAIEEAGEFASPILNDFINDSFREVNWWELAQHLFDNYWLSQDNPNHEVV